VALWALAGLRRRRRVRTDNGCVFVVCVRVHCARWPSAATSA
jgi:hypothetical protein